MIIHCKQAIYTALLLVVLAFSSVVSIGRSSECTIDVYPELAVANINADLSKGANAVVRYHNIDVTLQSVEKMLIRESAAVTVLNQRADYMLRFRESYKKSKESISNIEIEILDAKGGILKKVKSKELEEFAAQDGISIISDRMAIFYDYKTSDYPLTIKYSFEKQSGNTVGLPVWFPIPSDRISVEQSNYKVINNTSTEIFKHEVNLDGFNIQKNGEYNYSLTNAKRIINEKYTPDVMRIFPHIYFRPESFTYEGIQGRFSNWKGYGQWVYKYLLEPQKTFDKGKVGAELKELIPTDQPKEKIVQQIYEYVQQNTRYILVNLEDGGLVPMTSQDVHDLKYGDCKALTHYTQELLALYNIPSNYVINQAGSREQVDLLPEFCSVSQGNHIILQVPLEGDTLWMDCTSNDNPFNFLGSFTDDRLVFAVNKDGGALVRTPKYSGDLYRDEAKSNITLTQDGNVEIDYSLENYGLSMDDRMYQLNKGEEDFLDFLKEEYDHLLDVKISDVEYEIDKDNLFASESYKIKARDYAEKAGTYLILPQRFKPLSIPNLGKKKSRKFPILFERGYKEVKEDTYTIPDNFELKNIPDDIEIKGKYGIYSKKIEKAENGTFIIKRSFELIDAEYPADQYTTIKNFFNKIRKEESAKISIEKIIRP